MKPSLFLRLALFSAAALLTHAAFAAKPGPNPQPPPPSSGTLVLDYDPAGLYAENYGLTITPSGTNFSNGGFIVVDSSGDVFVTGNSWNGSNNDYVTIKYSSGISPPRLDFQLLNDELVLSWTNAGFSLQSAPAIPGTFTNFPGATSPYTNALTTPQQFFRLKGG